MEPDLDLWCWTLSRKSLECFLDCSSSDSACEVVKWLEAVVVAIARKGWKKRAALPSVAMASDYPYVSLHSF